MVTTIGSALSGAVLGFGAVYFAYCVLEAVRVSRTRVIRMPPNSDEDAERVFLKMLEDARSELLMYDDGDTDEDSLYQSRAVVERLEDKLTTLPDFRVRCVLNKPAGTTLFERRLGGHERVSVDKRGKNPRRTHYKIFDGKKAYVSRHRPGSKFRSRKVIDCTDAMPLFAKCPRALRRYFEDFSLHAV